MADWHKKYPVNYNVGGDDVYTGFVKIDNELSEIYDKLNILRTIQATSVLPANPKLNEIVLDLTDLKLKLWNGTSWINLFQIDIAPNADKVDGYHASQTPAANTIPVAGANALIANAWLANSIREFENPIDTIAYYNQTGQDYPLAVGEVAKISFSNVTSQPLRIATLNDSEYLLWIIPSDTGGTSGGSSSPIYLCPNNATYSDAFVYVEFFHNSNGPGSNYVTYSAFRIGYAFSHVFCVIRNLQQYKNVMGFYDVYGVSYTFPVSTSFSTDWRDTTTAWTSLGTIVWPQMSSGYVLVKRIL